MKLVLGIALGVGFMRLKRMYEEDPGRFDLELATLATTFGELAENISQRFQKRAE